MILSLHLKCQAWIQNIVPYSSNIPVFQKDIVLGKVTIHFDIQEMNYSLSEYVFLQFFYISSFLLL